LDLQEEQPAVAQQRQALYMAKGGRATAKSMSQLREEEVLQKWVGCGIATSPAMVGIIDCWWAARRELRSKYSLGE